MGIIVAGVAWYIHTHLPWVLRMYAPSDTVHMYQVNLSLLVYNKHLRIHNKISILYLHTYVCYVHNYENTYIFWLLFTMFSSYSHH